LACTGPKDLEMPFSSMAGAAAGAAVFMDDVPWRQSYMERAADAFASRPVPLLT
jgi:heterodisulfide reductase subunit A-like polyferredoxin